MLGVYGKEVFVENEGREAEDIPQIFKKRIRVNGEFKQ